MNNTGPFFNPFWGFQNNNENQNNLEKIMNKIERLEKNVRILENRINNLENHTVNKKIEDEPYDMYMI